MAQQFRPLQALARMGFALALGALMFGIIGALLTWLTPNEATSIPLLLLAPGVALLIAGAALTVFAFRATPETWQAAYRSCARLSFVLAALAALAIVVLALVFARGASVFQLILVALIGLEGPLVLALVGRRLRSISDDAR